MKRTLTLVLALLLIVGVASADFITGLAFATGLKEGIEETLGKGIEMDLDLDLPYTVIAITYAIEEDYGIMSYLHGETQLTWIGERSQIMSAVLAATILYEQTDIEPFVLIIKGLGDSDAI